MMFSSLLVYLELFVGAVQRNGGGEKLRRAGCLRVDGWLFRSVFFGAWRESEGRVKGVAYRLHGQSSKLGTRIQGVGKSVRLV